MNVMSAYKNWSRVYDSNENLTRDLDHIVLKKLLNNISDKYVVEAGCGTGKNTGWLAAKAAKIKAFDFSEEMLTIARKKIKADHVDFFRHDILKKWPIENEVADIVTINLVLEHLPAIAFPLHEAYRVLRSEGTLYICELHPRKHQTGSQARYIDSETNKEVKVDSYLHTETEYKEAGQNAGFKRIQFEDWYDNQNRTIPRLISVFLSK